MMHRLLMEEAQLSSAYAISPARSDGEIKDERESESLAAEFQSLLAQMSGQMVAIPDQIQDLSFALAQTAAPERVRPQEAREEDRAEVSLVELESEGAGDTYLLSNVNRSSAGDRFERYQDDGESSQNVKAQNVVNQSAADEIKPDAITVVSTLDSQVLEPVVTTDLIQLNAQLESIAETKRIIINDSNVEDIELKNEESTGEISFDYAEKEAILKVVEQGSGPLRVSKGDELEEASGDQETENDIFLQGVNAGLDRPDYEAQLRRNPASHGKEQHGSEDGSKGSLTTAQSKEDDLVFKGQGPVNPTQTGVATDDQIYTQQQKGGDGSRKIAQKSSDTPDFTQFQGPSLDHSRHEGGRSDSNMQMILLRQAFESVRLLRGNSSDTSLIRSQNQSIQGANASTAPKATQNAEGQKAPRQANRTQIARMLERVESTLKEAARARNGKTISLRLEPVDLGKVKVDVSLREGTLHARIAPDNQQVAQSLREHAHELQGALRKLGLDVDSVTVSVTVDDSFGEMATGQENLNGRSFQDERNKVPFEERQVVENTIGNELADSSRTDADLGRFGATGRVTDHWVA